MTLKEDIKKNEDSIKKLNVRMKRIYDIVNEIQYHVNRGEQLCITTEPQSNP